MRHPNDAGTLDPMPGRLLLGYARVSTDDQDLTNQRAELHAAGCTKLFSEKIAGTKRDRPELARLLDHLRPGDVVTVTRLDRLARSTRDLLDIAERIQAAGAGLRSLAEAAKARGVKFGPRPTLTPAQIVHARELIDQEGRTVKEAAALLGVHRSTLYRALDSSEEVSQAEAKRRGAFREDALTEADAVAAASQDERQEQRA